MLRFIARFVVVLVALFALMLFGQRFTETVSRIQEPTVVFEVEGTGQGPAGEPLRLDFKVDEAGMMELNGLPASISKLVNTAPLLMEGGAVTFQARRRQPIEQEEGSTAAIKYGDMRDLWTFVIRPDGSKTLDGEPARLADFVERIKKDTGIDQIEPTKPVLVEDVLKAEIAMPTRSRVSFPGRMTYKDAFPDATDEPEYVLEESQFDDAPLLHDREEQEQLGLYVDLGGGRKYWHLPDPETLPPVAERLPLNPAVTIGPDDADYDKPFKNRYGGTLRRSTNYWLDYQRKFGTESFLRMDPKGRLQPCLAYKWKVEDGNRIYTYWLRPDHKWSDGKPFTAQDFLFVSEDVIDTPYWPDYPMWMMPTDGSTQLYVDDVLDWPGFAAKVREQLAAEGPAPAKQMMSMIVHDIRETLEALAEEMKLAPERVEPATKRLNELEVQGENLRELELDALREQLEGLGLTEAEILAIDKAIDRMKLIDFRRTLLAVTPENPPDELTRQDLVAKINRTFRFRDFYSDEAWAGVDLHSERDRLRANISKLDKQGLWRLQTLRLRDDWLRRWKIPEDDSEYERAQLEDSEVLRMNLLLFRKAFPETLDKARRTRVKIEAVPDENGDDTHILRFVFPKPNSIFLEKTTHFMFYRGLFGMQRAYYREFHPDATDDLLTLDVRRWRDLLTTVKDQLKQEGANPGKQIWQALSEKTRTAVDEALQAEGEIPESVRDLVVAELNRRFKEKGFYLPEHWTTPAGSPVDFQAELDELTEDVYISKLAEFKAADKNRLNELQIRLDLLDRGEDDLTAKELFRFNQLMFRAAYDTEAIPVDEDDPPIIARNRVEALNLEAIEREHNGWVERMRQMKYRPPVEGEKDPIAHKPLLQAWRIITEPDEADLYFLRNPYYYRVDSQGNQLPYLDLIKDSVEKQHENLLLKIRAGAIDMQGRMLEFPDYTVLKQAERAGNYEVRLWANDYCGELTFYILQTIDDPSLHKIFNDPRFHYALSHALNREEMIEVVWKGMGEPRQWSVPKGSPYYVEEHAFAGIEYDPEKANRLLDEMLVDLFGELRRAGDDTRMYKAPDGEWVPLRLDVSTVQERPLAAVQMACEYWRDVGVNAHMKIKAGSQITREGQVRILEIGVHKEGGNFWGPTLAGGYAPTHAAECAQYPSWATWLRSGGLAGKEPPERVKEDERVWNEVLSAPNKEAQVKAWRKLTMRVVEMLPRLGIMTSPGKVMVVKNNVHNVPQLALAGWMAHEPGNVCPEVFYKEPKD